MTIDCKPSKLTLRVYNVGFGDCFLLTFHYPARDRHVLIDFGSTARPAENRAATVRERFLDDLKSSRRTGSQGESELLLEIAKDISKRCCGKLDAVVATHRHRDHVNGFTTRHDGKGPGDIIAACRPELVVQPWTEHPDAPSGTCFSLFEKRAGFVGENNLPNLSAVKNLQKMGRGNRYVYFGSDSGLESLLPGVTVHVLGPPTLDQSQSIRKKRTEDRGEFWLTRTLSSQGAGSRLFPRAATCPASGRALDTRWFLRRLQTVRSERLLEIVRELDTVLNNTSVIVLFEVGNKKLLFPGDAQIENWSYALSHPRVRQLLAGVNLYKVGHHGSRNATPKSLWNLFTRRSATPGPGRLRTVLSTLAHKFGEVDEGTEVPRASLVKTLRAQSDFFSTQDIQGKLYEDICINF
jgi:hypothetical protein